MNVRRRFSFLSLSLPLLAIGCESAPSRDLVVEPEYALRTARPQLDLPAGVYGGISLGYTKFGDYEESPGDTVDDEDFGWAIWTGYQISPNVAVTTGYIDFGQLHAEGPAGGGFTDDIDYVGIPLLLHGVVPFADRAAAFGSLGALFWNQDVDFLDGSGPFVADESGTSLALGLGLNYYVTPDKTVGLHFEVNHFFEVGDFDATGHDSDITFVTVGVLYRSP